MRPASPTTRWNPAFSAGSNRETQRPSPTPDPPTAPRSRSPHCRLPFSTSLSQPWLRQKAILECHKRDKNDQQSINSERPNLRTNRGYLKGRNHRRRPSLFPKVVGTKADVGRRTLSEGISMPTPGARWDGFITGRGLRTVAPRNHPDAMLEP